MKHSGIVQVKHSEHDKTVKKIWKWENNLSAIFNNSRAWMFTFCCCWKRVHGTVRDIRFLQLREEPRCMRGV